MRRAWIAAAVCAASVGSAHADWTVKRSPFDATVAARYKQILSRDPYDASAFAALEAMYARYRSIQKLESELGDDWASSVLRARLDPGGPC